MLYEWLLDVKLRLDHTLSQSTDKLRSDNSLFQIVLIERGFVIQSIILLYIKETDCRPADGQHIRMISEDHVTVMME